MHISAYVYSHMERVLGLGVGPLAAGTVGLLILLKVIQRLRHKQSVQDKVVVITGASSGLGKGYMNIISLIMLIIMSHQWHLTLHHCFNTLNLYIVPQSVRGSSMRRGPDWSCADGTRRDCRRSWRSWETKPVERYRWKQILPVQTVQSQLCYLLRCYIH